MSQVSKHSVELAEMVVEAEIFPAILSSLRDPDDYVIKNVATLIREIAKHSPEVWRERGEREREREMKSLQQEVAYPNNMGPRVVHVTEKFG